MTRPSGFPDFFVIGAPRCGTTSLCRDLSHHPHICFSEPKEPHYFSRISELPSESRLRDEYLGRYFGRRDPAHRATGEGSVSYLYRPEAIEWIRHFNPDARFIAMVRNPLSMLPSYHQKMCFLLQEDETDFASAWRLQDARARGQQVPRHCHDPRVLLYGEVARFGRQIERLFGQAGRERTHVVVFDDFVADPLAAYRGVLNFLQIDYDQRTRFPRRNESRIYRYRWLQELLFLPASRGQSITGTVPKMGRKDKHVRSKKKSMFQRLAAWNRIPVPPSPLARDMRATVAEHLRSDVELLSRLLGRDLSHWLAEAG